jgi:2-dehydro-3-deoxyphosphogluconate aldolase/(4S)-4-hydroxy-2-oxoglutarate aldolase
VLDPDQLARAHDAGASFIVAPGLTERVTRAALDRKLAYLPGVATAGDIMRGLEWGLSRFKFFPAVAAGGLPALDALSGPFADVRFCPTGGIRRDSAREWLAHRAVTCVGGTWLVPQNETDLAVIGALGRDAAALRR